MVVKIVSNLIKIAWPIKVADNAAKYSRDENQLGEIFSVKFFDILERVNSLQFEQHP